jgi:hypothetical protein
VTLSHASARAQSHKRAVPQHRNAPSVDPQRGVSPGAHDKGTGKHNTFQRGQAHRQPVVHDDTRLSIRPCEVHQEVHYERGAGTDASNIRLWRCVWEELVRDQKREVAPLQSTPVLRETARACAE